jgi:hypothetical protein
MTFGDETREDEAAHEGSEGFRAGSGIHPKARKTQKEGADLAFVLS